MRQLATALVILATVPPLRAQESDHAYLQTLRGEIEHVQHLIHNASTARELDSAALRLTALEERYGPRREFIDRSLHPETLEGTLQSLRTLIARSYEQTLTAEEYALRIRSLEEEVQRLASQLDTLATERKQIYERIAEAERTATDLQATVRRLTRTLQTKDRLIFALVDSIFLHYDKDVAQNREAKARSAKMRLGLVNRIFDVVADNIRFVEVTSLQGRDYSSLLDHYQQFQAKWSGLRDRVNAAELGDATTSRTPGTGQQTAPLPGAHVDSLLVLWETKLNEAFWRALQDEFVARNIDVQPFFDPASFSASIRAYVDSVKGRDDLATEFARDLWKERIDKEWRSALSKEGMLGPVEYAALDQLVSELSQRRVDSTFALTIGIVIAVVLIVWWYLRRTPTPPNNPSTQQHLS